MKKITLRLFLKDTHDHPFNKKNIINKVYQLKVDILVLYVMNHLLRNLINPVEKETISKIINTVAKGYNISITVAKGYTIKNQDASLQEINSANFSFINKK